MLKIVVKVYLHDLVASQSLPFWFFSGKEQYIYCRYLFSSMGSFPDSKEVTDAQNLVRRPLKQLMDNDSLFRA
jgi:hypothetical protein